MPRNEICWSKEALRNPRPLCRLPRLFGVGGRDRVLICLAVNGAMYVRQIGRLAGIDSHKCFDMIGRLADAGLVVKRNREGGRKYAALNRGLRCYPQLLNGEKEFKRLAAKPAPA